MCESASLLVTDWSLALLGICFAIACQRDVDFANAKSTGAIAQLGERLLCKQEVVGSIPSGSTKFLLRKNVRAEAIAFRQMRARFTQLLKLVKLRTYFTELMFRMFFHPL